MEKERKDPKEKKCAICGKDIYAGEEWAYKRREKSERTKWFCSYKCMRQYDAKHGPKQARPVGLPADLDAAAPKEAKKPKKMPTERGCIARSLIDVIRAGEDPIKYLQKQGYKNPYEAYSSVRHYCETNEPHLNEVLKPLKELRKAEVRKVDKVPDIEQLEEQVAEMLNLQGGVNYQLKVDEAMKAEVKPFGENFHYQGFKVTGIETEFGRFDWNVGRTLITFTYEDEEINILPGDLKTMADQLPEILSLLGVTK